MAALFSRREVPQDVSRPTGARLEKAAQNNFPIHRNLLFPCPIRKCNITSFLNPDDDRVLDEILAQKVPGTPFTIGTFTSREDLRKKLKEAQVEHEQKPESIPVSPQRRRRTTRKRISERTNSVVARILKDLGLSIPGREVARAIPEMDALKNRSAVTQLLNREINNFLNIKSCQRNQLKAAQTEQAFDKLDSLGDKVRDMIALKLGGKNA